MDFIGQVSAGTVVRTSLIAEAGQMHKGVRISSAVLKQRIEPFGIYL